MTEKLKTHEERAHETAACIVELESFGMADDISPYIYDGTYPTELLAWARFFLSDDGHFDECLPGKRGNPPGPGCSRMCVKLRETLALYEEQP